MKDLIPPSPTRPTPTSINQTRTAAAARQTEEAAPDDTALRQMWLPRHVQGLPHQALKIQARQILSVSQLQQEVQGRGCTLRARPVVRG